jgi:hypothetical protein
MVWLPGEDLVGPEELLEQHDARELVRKCYPSEGKPLVGSFQHAWFKAKRAADDEAQVLSRVAALFQQIRELDARAFLSFPVECDDECSCRNVAKYLPRFLLE